MFFKAENQLGNVGEKSIAMSTFSKRVRFFEPRRRQESDDEARGHRSDEREGELERERTGRLALFGAAFSEERREGGRQAGTGQEAARAGFRFPRSIDLARARAFVIAERTEDGGPLLGGKREAPCGRDSF